jgi:hypothetical protein
MLLPQVVDMHLEATVSHAQRTGGEPPISAAGSDGNQDLGLPL